MPKGIYIRTKSGYWKDKKFSENHRENLSKSHIGQIAWNKGTENICKPNSGSFKKGQHPSPKTEFKKGHKLRIGLKHSEEVKQRIRNSKIGKYLGKNNPSWKGGITKNPQGYIFIYKPKHPFSHKRYVKRARLVMEKILNRYLKSEEIVHHINGIKDDDSPKNLKLLSNRSIHIKLHFKKIL